MKRFLLLAAVLLPRVASADAPDVAPLRRWVTRQAEVRTVQADFTQTRTFHALRDPQARKALAAFRLDFDLEDGRLLDFELALKDGSSLRNEFTNVRLNGKIDPHVFDYDFTGYEVTDAK